MTTTNDREWAFLAEATGEPGPFNDMYFRYLRGLGYTGTLQDMIAKSGRGLTPSKGGGAPFRVTDNILGSGGLDYALYSASDLDRMWQQSIGQTPAALAQPVGLGIGREKQGRESFAEFMAEQAEKIINGTFDTNTDGWVADAAALSIVNQALRVVNSGGSEGSARQSFTATVARLLQVKFDIVSAEPAAVVLSNALARAGYANGSHFRFGLSSSASVNIQLRTNNANVGNTRDFDNVSVKEVPAHYARQDTSGQRPALQADGIKFDGVSQNLLTDWFAQAGANCIIAQVNVPAVLSAQQLIAGAISGQRLLLGLGQSGQLVGGIGDDSTGVITAPIDLRGSRAVVMIQCSGTSVALRANAAEVYSGVQNGSPPTNVACMIGAANNAGAALQPYSGWVERIAFGRTALTFEQFQQIRAEWLAAT